MPLSLLPDAAYNTDLPTEKVVMTYETIGHAENYFTTENLDKSFG